MVEIMILPKGAVSKPDLARLRKAGICAIEADDPAMVRSSRLIEKSDDTSIVLHSALDAIRKLSTDSFSGKDAKAQFAMALFARMPFLEISDNPST